MENFKLDLSKLTPVAEADRVQGNWYVVADGMGEGSYPVWINRWHSGNYAMRVDGKMFNSWLHWFAIPPNLPGFPEGYEFCAESEAEKWVNVENNILTGYSVGEILLGNPMGELRKNSRPIRKTPTDVKQLEHECKYCGAMTSQPDEQCYKNPYAVDWSNAPDWADVHAFDKDGKGYWYGIKKVRMRWSVDCEWCNSPFTLPAGLDWKQSKTLRPR